MFDPEQLKRDFVRQKPPDQAPKNWVVHQFKDGTGGFVADYEEFIKLPKRQQEKALKA